MVEGEETPQRGAGVHRCGVAALGQHHRAEGSQRGKNAGRGHLTGTGTAQNIKPENLRVRTGRGYSWKQQGAELILQLPKQNRVMRTQTL